MSGVLRRPKHEKLGGRIIPGQRPLPGIDAPERPNQIQIESPKGEHLLFNTSPGFFVSAMTAPTLTKVLRSLAASALALLILAMTWGAAAGQGLATLRVEENLRADPQGLILGRLQSGSSFPVVSLQSSWAQVEVDGWI